MNIHHLGNRAISLYISGDKLSQLGVSPSTIGRQAAEDILAEALSREKITGWEPAEMEVYPGKDSILLFVRRKASVPSYFLFSDFEDLITAAHLLKHPLPSSLNKTSDGYILTVYPFDGDDPPGVLYEFGRELIISHYLLEHMEEHGGALLPASALMLLREYFMPEYKEF